MTEQPTCEQLIEAKLKAELEGTIPDWEDMDFDAVLEWAKDYDIDCEGMSIQDAIDGVRSAHEDRMREGVLSVEKKRLYSVCLSWGGPSDGFDFVFTDDELTECYYWYKDWFDGARRPVPMEQAERLADLYCVGPQFE